jgi:hypothetical protein
MSIADLLTAIQKTPLSRALAGANHLVMAGLQVVHVVGFILLLASAVLISLRVLGWVLKETPVAEVARDTTRLLWLGLALAVLSGVLMFIGAPKHYFYNPAFTTKMVLLLFAVIVQGVVFTRVATSRQPRPLLARVGVALTLICWFSVSLAGRAIGFV